MGDQIERALSYWSADDVDPEVGLHAEWQRYRNHFALSQPSQRVDDLQRIDSFLSDPRPTKETASVWTKARDLHALHKQLLRIGK